MNKSVTPLLNVAAAVWAPLQNNCSLEGSGTLARTPSCPKPGLSTELLAHLLHTAGMAARLIPLRGRVAWGSLDEKLGNCTFDGVLGGIYNGTYDTLSTEWYVTPERSACFVFTNPTVYTDNVLVYKGVPDPRRNLYALLRVYEPVMWLGAVLSVVLLSLLLAVVSKALAREPGQLARPFLSHSSEALWQMVQFVVDQSSGIPTTFAARSHSARCLLSVMGIFSIFFLKLYEGGLLASVVAPLEVTPFADVDALAELVKEGKARYMVEEDTSYDAYLKDETLASMVKMRAASEGNPVIRVGSPGEGLERLRREPAGSVGFMIGETSVKTQLSVDCELRFHYERSLPKPRMAFMFRKSLGHIARRLAVRVNSAVSHAEHLNRRYYAAAQRVCAAGEQRLGLGNLAGVFPLCGALLAAAALAFCLERRRCLGLLRHGRPSGRPLKRRKRHVICRVCNEHLSCANCKGSVVQLD